MGRFLEVPFIKPKEYLELSEQGKYQTARLIGTLNQKLKEHSVLLIGPGRRGTITPSLGVPVHFSELCNMATICEVSYAAIFKGESDVVFYPEKILSRENLLREILQGEKEWERVIHLARTAGLTLYSDITSQQPLCFG